MMKKIFAILLAAVIVLSLGVIAVSAADDGIEVYVTITDGTGAIVAAAEKITVTDSDSDGKLTINDALYAAHEASYTGGAQAGYATLVTQYGLGITKLWGDTCGSYGYYVNNKSAWSLEDPIAAGDYVAAFVYTDATGWSDKFSYFDSFKGSVKTGEELTLTYYVMSGYDDDWNPVFTPTAGAAITVDGTSSGLTTDADGKVKLTLNDTGAHIISATVEGARVIAPVFVASVTAEPIPGNPDVIDTGDSTPVFFVLSVMMIALAAIIILRKNYAK